VAPEKADINLGKNRPQCVLIVLDSVGIGELPDAAEFGDVGADTLGNISARHALRLPNLFKLGLNQIERGTKKRPLSPLSTQSVPLLSGAYGRMIELSRGKDSATGHWEMMGLITQTPFKAYPDGFPDTLVDSLISRCKLPGFLGNCAESGTEIIKRLGEQHIISGMPILYTSADPVLQIAAHEDCIDIKSLYTVCQHAYELSLPFGINRVIARPFKGKNPSFVRTSNRKDFTMPPTGKTVLDGLVERGVHVVGIGKTGQLFAHRGFSATVKTENNEDGIEKTISCMHTRRAGFIFTNLVDFDSKYGHRRDPAGYAKALESFDLALPRILDAMGPDDLLFITADHGNDPTFKGTDHTREFVLLLVAGKQISPINLGTRKTFADLGATVSDFLGYKDVSPAGISFLPLILEETIACI
jgi:phosphopentomutase